MRIFTKITTTTWWSKFSIYNNAPNQINYKKNGKSNK